MAFLKIVSGDMKGCKFEIDRDTVVIGRAPDNIVSIKDPLVSGRHCSILREGRRYTLRDMESTNGTYLNDVRIKEYQLNPKDIIKVGSVEILFDGPDVEEKDAQPVAPTVAEARIKNSALPGPSWTNAPATFVAKRDAKWKWIAVICLIGILVLAALGWYVSQLLKS